jgi:hypothetical protein
MKRIIPAVLVALLFITGCPAPETNEPPVDVKPVGGNVAVPGTQYNFLAAFTSALPCNGQALQWSIREQSIGWLPVDGAITQNGIWTSPACGSVWLGQILHIDAKCVATGQTASAAIATVPEQVTGVQIAYAVVTNIGQAACLAPNAAAPNVQPGGQIQFYARVITSCGEVITPEPPATWPATCL